MNQSLLFYATIATFGIIYIVLALLPRKQIKNKTDYFLAGRNLTVIKATCTLIATQLGAGLLLGTSQQAYHIGLYSLLFTLGISIGLIILGCGLAGKLRSLHIVTTTEIFEKKYHSAALRQFASLIVTLTLCGILVGNMVASKSLMQSLGFENDFFFALFWLFIIVYTMVGGLHAVVLTDLVQVSFIVIVFIGVTIYSLFNSEHTLGISSLAAVQKHFSGQLPDTSHLINVLLMPALFALFEQDLAQIFFASQTKTVATIAAIMTTIFMLTFGLIPIYFGIQANLSGLIIPANHSPLLAIINHITGEWMVVMIASGILAAIASTADALLCAIGANLTQDFSFAFLRLSPVIESKVVTCAMGVIVFGASYLMPKDIITILVSSYAIPVSMLLIPIIAAYFMPQVKIYAGFGGVVGGIIGLIIFYFTPIPFHALFTLLFSFTGYIIGHIIQPSEQY